MLIWKFLLTLRNEEQGMKIALILTGILPIVVIAVLVKVVIVQWQKGDEILKEIDELLERQRLL